MAKQKSNFSNELKELLNDYRNQYVTTEEMVNHIECIALWYSVEMHKFVFKNTRDDEPKVKNYFKERDNTE
jgi:hypothetical protein